MNFDRELLTAEKANSLFWYDPESGNLLWKIRTCQRCRVGDVVGSLDRHGHRRVRVENKSYGVHRIIWLMHYGSLPDGLIDHINGIGSDNHIANLRIADKSENGANRAAPKNNTSGVKGVTFFKRDKIWQVIVTFKKRQYYIGRFKNKEDAIKAQKDASARIHGRYACFRQTRSVLGAQNA